MNNITSITELVLNGSKSREEIAVMFGIRERIVLDIEEQLKDSLEDETINDQEFIEICDDIDSEYSIKM